MPREHEDYRLVLEQLLIYFDGKRLLTAKDVARHDDKDRRTVAKKYGISGNGISIYVLARKICEL